MTEELSIKGIVKEIHEAFADVSRPEDSQIAPFEVDEDTLDCDEKDAWLALRGKQWDELDSSYIYKNYDAIYFITPSAFLYFFPAFLLAVVNKFDPEELLTYCLVTIAKASSRDVNDHWYENILLLNEVQLRAFASVMRYFDTYYPEAFDSEIDNLEAAIKNLERLMEGGI